MFCSYEFALSNSVIVFFVSIVVSMEINRRHYFRSGCRIICFWDMTPCSQVVTNVLK